MHITLAYGKTGLALELPDDLCITVVEPHFVKGLEQPVEALRQALQKPHGAPPLQELVTSDSRVGIIFNDITRPAPSHLMLPAILDELAAVPVADEQITLFNATGTHRVNTDAELRSMVGDEIVERYRIMQHDGRQQDSHKLVGTTQRGSEAWLERAFLDCDVKILTGFIEPHLFAGFSGGGKAIMPGLASLDTVMRNHDAQHLDHPNATWGITHGNPLWEEIQEIALMAAPTFLLNVALNRDKEITAVFAGDLEDAHAQGCAFVKETAMVPVESPFDIVITTNSGYPLDLNLYQSIKGMSAAAPIVKPGGSILIAAECWDGIPEHGSYGTLVRDADSLDALLQQLRQPGFSQDDMWQAHTQALIQQKADVYVYSDGLDEAQIRSMKLHPCQDVAATVAQLLETYGKEASICVLPEGPQTIPYISS